MAMLLSNDENHSFFSRPITKGDTSSYVPSLQLTDNTGLIEPNIKYFITILFDGFETTADIIVIKSILTLVDRLSNKHCRVILFHTAQELEFIKSLHSLRGKTSPIVLLSEESPLSQVKESLAIELGTLTNADDIKKVLASIIDHACTDDMVGVFRRGETLRKTKKALERFGLPIMSALTSIGLG